MGYSKRMPYSAKQVSIAGLVGALYFAITITPGISAISYGQFQLRIAEALTVLPFLYPGTIAGLFVGCLLANLFGPFGIQDVVFGSLLTLAAAWLTFLTRKVGRPALAPLPPVVLNAFGVSAYLHLFFGEPLGVCFEHRRRRNCRLLRSGISPFAIPPEKGKIF